MATPTKTYNVTQLQSLSPSAQQSYLADLQTRDPQQAAALRAQLAMAANNARHDFMRMSLRKIAPCANASGAGYAQTYAPGSTLIWDLPVVENGYAAELVLEYNILVNPATGTGAAYGASVAAPTNIFQEVNVTYNGTQLRFLMYFQKIVSTLRGYLRGAPGISVAGNSVSNIQTQENNGNTLTINTNNNWIGKIRIPLNSFGRNDWRGVLPIDASGTKPQLKVQCAQNFLGADPLLSPVATTGGTGAAITINAPSTVNAYVEYLDGTGLDQLQIRKLDLTGQPTVQVVWDQPLNPLSANLIMRQRILTLKRHMYVVSIVIDGQQLQKFSTVPNITGLQLSPDDTGNNSFKIFGLQSNVPVYDMFDQTRQLLGQDLDEGVIPWFLGPLDGIPDPSNHNSGQVLDMTPGHWTATTHAYQVTAVGATAGITPRVETFVVTINDKGFQST